MKHEIFMEIYSSGGPGFQEDFFLEILSMVVLGHRERLEIINFGQNKFSF